MQYITDPDMEMIYEINARRRAEKAEALRKCEARVAHEKAKRAFWRLVRRAAIECGSCLCIAYLLRIFEHDNLRTCCKAFRLFLMCQIGKHNLRLQYPHDRRDSFYRHLTVEWAVKITAVKCSKKACNTVNIFIHKNSDRVSHGLHFFCQHIAYFSGKSADLCISINLFAIFKRFLFWMKLRIPLQIFQYTLYHCFLLLLFFHYFLCFSITAMIASTESKFSGTTSLTGISTPIS